MLTSKDIEKIVEDIRMELVKDGSYSINTSVLVCCDKVLSEYKERILERLEGINTLDQVKQLVNEIAQTI